MVPRTLPQRTTHEDYLRLPDDGKRYEILDGVIHVTPTPSTRHQYTSFQLQRILAVARGPQLSDRGVDGAPLLVVEILSPSRPHYDRVTKAKRYATRAVPHYWIVDPQARSLECHRLEDRAYRLEVSGSGSETVRVSSFEGPEIPLGEFWLE